jgi:hypothetical protein
MPGIDRIDPLDAHRRHRLMRRDGTHDGRLPCLLTLA